MPASRACLEEIKLYNYTNNTLDTVDSRDVATADNADAWIYYSVPWDVDAYRNSSNEQVKARIKFTKSGASFNAYIDLMQWEWLG